MSLATKAHTHTSPWESFRHFASDIKLSHSIFALPFAASAVPLANLPLPSLLTTVKLLICMVAARSFAMGMNRYLDRDIDQENPRTALRAIPRGAMSANETLVWAIIALTIFVSASYAINHLTGILAIPLAVILAIYSKMKHWTVFTHWYLGICLGLAPIGAGVALTGAILPELILLGTGVALWTAGFDILYSLQDMVFDQHKSLKSVPSPFGPRSSLALSRLSFAASILSFCGVGYVTASGFTYYAGVTAIAILLSYEHWLVRDARHDGTSKNINQAFFNSNACVSLIFFASVVIDRFL